MKCLHLLVVVLILVVPVMAQKSGAFPSGRVVDLTYAFDANSVYWPTAEQFKLETDFEGMTDKGYFYSAYRYSAAEHGGTHLDSPVHFAKGHYTVDQLPLEQLMGSAIVIDVTSQCATNPDYLVSVADFENWEKRNGKIPAGTIVLFARGLGSSIRIGRSILGLKSVALRRLRSYTFRDWIRRQRAGSRLIVQSRQSG